MESIDEVGSIFAKWARSCSVTEFKSLDEDEWLDLRVPREKQAAKERRKASMAMGYYYKER